MLVLEAKRLLAVVSQGLAPPWIGLDVHRGSLVRCQFDGHLLTATGFLLKWRVRAGGRNVSRERNTSGLQPKGRLQSKECLEDLHGVLLVRPVSPLQPTNPKIGKKFQTARTRIRTLECFQLRQSEATGVR